MYFQQAGSVNLMRLPAPTPYAFGLAVTDALFTKQELASSLLFDSKKSDKPKLDPKRVEILLGMSTVQCRLRTHTNVHVLVSVQEMFVTTSNT